MRYNKVSLMGRKELKVKIRSRNGKLYVDYYVEGQRVRRATGLGDTPKNRSAIEKDIIPKIQAKILLGEYGQTRAKALTHYSARYLKSKEELISYRTKESRVKVIEEHLGHYTVDRITRSSVKEFIALFRDHPYTAKEYLTELRGILNVALDDEVIDKNPAETVKIGKLGNPEIDPFSAEEVSAIMAHAQGMFRNYLGIAFNTGMRSGEVIGLMRNDIGEMLHVRRTVTRGRVKEPKTLGSIRLIPMFDIVRLFIDQQIKQCRSLYLFEKNGEHLGDISYFRRQWRTTLKKAGVRYRKLYNTRHTFITAMLNSGQFSIMQIAKMVGHSSPRMIMSTYAGFVKSEHLKIDASTDLFGHNMGTVENKGEVLKASEVRFSDGGA